MKKFVKMFVLFSLTTIIGFYFVACSEAATDNTLGTPDVPSPLNGTPGLAFTLINGNTAYSVSKGTATAAAVVIPIVYEGLPVTAIADSGFSSYTNMTSIIIPNGVTRIGNYAFFLCSNLVSVAIPAGVTNIGNFAFENCSSLTTVFYSGENISEWSSIAIGSNNTFLTNATYYCYSSTIPDITHTHWRYENGIPVIWELTPGLVFTLIDGTAYSVSKGTATAAAVVISPLYKGLPVTTITNSGFSHYVNMTSLTIPNSVTSIGNDAFYSCIGLTSLIMPNSVESIGDNAFSHCIGLTSLTIPDSVESIGNGAFDFCNGLTNVTILDNVENIGDGVFFFCTKLTNVTISDSVQSIGTAMFVGCTSLKNISIGSSLKSIGTNTFNGCTSLESIIIPDSVESIEAAAFLYCTSMESIIIPDSVESIGNGAFFDCTKLISVTLGTVTVGVNGAFPGGGYFEVAYFAVEGGAGTYTRVLPSSVWTKQ